MKVYQETDYLYMDPTQEKVKQPISKPSHELSFKAIRKDLAHDETRKTNKHKVSFPP